MKKKVISFMLATIMVFVSTANANAVYLDIKAEAAYVMDAQTGETLYEKDAYSARVPASMTKVLTAYIVYEELAKGTLTMDTPIWISENVAEKSRDSAYPMAVPLEQGSTYPLETLLNLIMIPSASASCIAVAEHISGSEQAFVNRMNDTAKKLGLQATYHNCHGAQPNYITARSQALLIQAFIKTYPDILKITSKPSYYFNGRTYNNTNYLLNSMPYDGADGFKTGTISAAGYCVTTTAERNGRRVISVVMKSSSGTQRFVDSRVLLDYGFEEIARNDASRATTVVNITNAPNEISAYKPFSVSANITGVSDDYIASAQWYLNDTPINNYGNSWFNVQNNKTSTLNAVLTDISKPEAKLSFVIKMFDGTEKRADITVPVNQTPITYTGNLNIKSAEVYAGEKLTVSANITGENNINSVSLPVEWKFNGQYITGNKAFTVKNDNAQSQYTFKMPQKAGTYKLEFVLGSNTNAVNPLVLTADITVIEK